MTRRVAVSLVVGLLSFTGALVAAGLPHVLPTFHPCLVEHPIHVPEDDSQLCQNMLRLFQASLWLFGASLLALGTAGFLYWLDRRTSRIGTVT